MPTIKDVAREAGVSIATVSYVINNKDIPIRDDTRRLVWEAVERIGYTPNVTARNLKASQSRLIGYAWHDVPPDEVNAVLDRFTYFTAQAAEEAGYHILTFTHTQDNVLDVYSELIRTRRVDAFVLAGTMIDDPRIEFLMAQGFPFATFGRSNPAWDFPWVDTDGLRGSYDAVGHLVRLGHRRIAMIAWPEASLAGEFRVRGYLQALRAAGIPFRESYLWRGSHSEQTGRDALAYWSQMPFDERPTGVIAVSDLAAIGVLNEAEARGLGDVSVVGFDDVPLSQYLRPSLTTLRQPIPEISRALIHMLQAILNGETPDPYQVALPPQLIIRASTGAPPVK